MFVKIWGCRGGISAPATEKFDTRIFGGHTTCFEIRTSYKNEEELSIVDMGTGLMNLGNDLLKNNKNHSSKTKSNFFKGRFFLTHMHLDHTFGLGFFAPIFFPDYNFEFYAQQVFSTISTLNHKLAGLYDGLKFPRHLHQLPGIREESPTCKAFHESKPWHTLFFKTCKVSMVELNHPFGCTGWRFQERNEDGSYSGAVLAVATDNEHYSVLNTNLNTLLKNADLAILDGQYSENEYQGTFPDYADSKVGWGHSTPEASLLEASARNVKYLGITHHDPLNDDQELLKREAKLIEQNKKSKNHIEKVFFLREGEEFNI